MIDQSRPTLVVFGVLYDSGRVPNFSGIVRRCFRLSFVFLRGRRRGICRVKMNRASFVQFYARSRLDWLCSLAFGALESRHIEESQEARRGIVVFLQIDSGHFCNTLDLGHSFTGRNG